MRARVRIEGRVQGVGFRWATRQEAVRLGLAGWVRNTPDGAVEAAFEGPADRVDEMLAWCRHGPGTARVDRVTTQPEAPTGETGFVVDR